VKAQHPTLSNRVRAVGLGGADAVEEQRICKRFFAIASGALKCAILPVKQDLGVYVEFHHASVRFAICARSVRHEASGHTSFAEARHGQAFELAFPCGEPAEVDRVYAEIVAQGATPVHAPADMPWGQRTALFADPDGNIHELFADLPQ
jgi:uncharacterized glyoxalase superfamily protein PhnB